MLVNFYLRKGVVYLPTLAKIQSGGYWEGDPVAVIPVNDSDALRTAFHETLSRGNPPIPPFKDGYPPAAILKYAGVKRYGTFERGTLSWLIREKDGIFKVIYQKNVKDSGWVDDPDRIITLPPTSTIDDVCDRVVAILQAHAR